MAVEDSGGRKLLSIRISGGHFFLAVFFRVSLEELSKRGTTCSRKSAFGSHLVPSYFITPYQQAGFNKNSKKTKPWTFFNTVFLRVATLDTKSE